MNWRFLNIVRLTSTREIDFSKRPIKIRHGCFLPVEKENRQILPHLVVNVPLYIRRSSISQQLRKPIRILRLQTSQNKTTIKTEIERVRQRRDKIEKTDQAPRLHLPLKKKRNETSRLILTKLRSSHRRYERENSEIRLRRIQRVEALAEKNYHLSFCVFNL